MLKRAMLVGAAAAALLAAVPGTARADDDKPRVRTGVSFGPRGMYYKPRGGEDSWSGGAQLRLHLTPVVAIEGSADYRQTRVGGNIVDVYPLQASALLYLVPNSPVSPYILGGGGWYFTNVRPEDRTENRFAPHAGAGLQFFFDKHWSIDGSYRYIWASDVETRSGNTTARFRDEGYMVTAGLNYRF